MRFLLVPWMVASAASLTAPGCSGEFDVIDGVITTNMQEFKVLDVASVEECCAACSAYSSGCTAWDFVSNVSVCKLHSGVGGTGRSSGHTVGRRAPVSSPAAPHIILTIIVDDLGAYDSQVNNPRSPTPTIGQLADEGLRLDRYYTYSTCSPSRRSFLSGRLPVHIGANQAGTCSNFLPLNFTLLSEKLKTVGFENHFVGKGHLGYQTEDHMPINRGFDSHLGYLHADEDYDHGNMSFKSQAGVYWKKDFWHGTGPGDDLVDEIEYSTNFYTRSAVEIINNYDGLNPLWLHLAYQGVHAPYVNPPAWEHVCRNVRFS